MKLKTPFFYVNIEITFIIILLLFFISPKVHKLLYYYYACYLFIVYHELGHMCIATIVGKKVKEFKITMAGVCIRLDKGMGLVDSRILQILVYIAGPISNLVLAMIFKNNNMIFDVNIFLFLINLLPIYPLDGYNILKCVLSSLFEIKKIYKILNEVSNTCVVMLFVTGIVQIFISNNFSIVIFSIYLILLKNKYYRSEKYDKIIQKIRC